MDYFAAMRALVRTVELGSFSKAAHECGAKVSTVSRYVAALEADLGVALLNRSTRKLHLTEAGQTFYDRACSIVAEVEDARRATSALNNEPRGLLRINIPGAFGRLHVVPAMPSFLAAHPGIKLELHISDARVDLIETGTDVAIRVGLLPDSTMQARRLCSHVRLLCASPAFANAASLLDPAGLAEVECLSMPQADRWYFRPNARRGGKPAPSLESVSVSGRLFATDLQAVRCASVAGLGVALLPSWLVSDDFMAGRLTRVLPEWDFSTTSNFDQAIWALYPPKKVVSPKVRSFIDHMHSLLDSAAFRGINRSFDE